MKIVIVYVHPKGWTDYAVRFLESYHNNPPGGDHDTIVVCNGGYANGETRFLFESLPNLSLVEHDNSGYDIGAFQLVAATVPADLMLFFGASAYFRRGGWIHRVVESYHKYGRNNIYGATGHQGVPGIWPHIRTTGFWCSPHVINEHPMRVNDAGLRYPYEHGEGGLTTWITRDKRQRAIVVGWTGEIDVFACDSLQSGYHHGEQYNLLFGDRMTCPPFYPYP